MSSALSEHHSSPPPPPKPRWWKQFTKSPLQTFDLLPQTNNNNQLSKNFKPNNLNNTVININAVFGAALEDALQRASVAISMVGPDQKAYIYGFIPVVVAKCGLYLKENGTTVEGIFRISGSTKRMRELQRIFDEPPLYGKDLDWKDPNPLSEPNNQKTNTNNQIATEIESNKPYFSVHDAANVLRRYLMALPEPLIPATMYHDFRQVLQKHSNDTQKQVRLFKSLISTLNPPSQYLLLYLLDLLAVFANRSQLNLMTANNLAVVFQPALCPTTNTLNHSEKFNRIIYHNQNLKNGHGGADHQDPNQPNPPKSIQQESLQEQSLIMKEAKQAQEVLEFLIMHQNFFVLGLRPQIKPTNPVSELGDAYNQNRSKNECASEDERDFTTSTPRPSPTTAAALTRRSLHDSNGLVRPSSSCSVDEDELMNQNQPISRRSSGLSKNGNEIGKGGNTNSNGKGGNNDSVRRSKTLPSGQHNHHHLSKSNQWNNNDVYNQTVGTPVETLDQIQRTNIIQS